MTTTNFINPLDKCCNIVLYVIVLCVCFDEITKFIDYDSFTSFLKYLGVLLTSCISCYAMVAVLSLSMSLTISVNNGHEIIVIFSQKGNLQ